eukprot:763389-Amphidinium_carterae.1
MDHIVDVKNPIEVRMVPCSITCQPAKRAVLLRVGTVPPRVQVNPKPGDQNDALVLSMIHGAHMSETKCGTLSAQDVILCEGLSVPSKISSFGFDLSCMSPSRLCVFGAFASPLDAGVVDVHSRVVYGLLGSILGNLAFNELRTERHAYARTKQLGYIVDGGMSVLGNALYVSVIVQGKLGAMFWIMGTKERADQTEVLSELLYQKLMPEMLANMTEEDFQ